MALDSRDKRSSAINVSSPWRGLLPVPDGTIDQADRQHLAFIYRGIQVVTNVTLTPAVFTNTQTFGTPVVSATYAITGTVFTNTNTFGTAVVAHDDETLTATLFTNANSFGTAVVTPGPVDVAPSLFTNTNSFGTASVAFVLQATLFTNTNSFGTHAISLFDYGEKYRIRGKSSAISIEGRGTGYSIKGRGAGVTLTI